MIKKIIKCVWAIIVWPIKKLINWLKSALPSGDK